MPRKHADDCDDEVVTQPTGDRWPAAMSGELLSNYLSISVRWINQQVAAGAFPRPRKLGRTSRWIKSEVDAWLASREMRAA